MERSCFLISFSSPNSFGSSLRRTVTGKSEASLQLKCQICLPLVRSIFNAYNVLEH